MPYSLAAAAAVGVGYIGYKAIKGIGKKLYNYFKSKSNDSPPVSKKEEQIAHQESRVNQLQNEAQEIPQKRQPTPSLISNIPNNTPTPINYQKDTIQR